MYDEDDTSHPTSQTINMDSFRQRGSPLRNRMWMRITMVQWKDKEKGVSHLFSFSVKDTTTSFRDEQ